MYKIPMLPLNQEIETKAILKQVSNANKRLAELKGIARTIPNENILINSLVLQEAKDSSAVENIVTTHDELYKAEADRTSLVISSSTKEVLHYSEALKHGFALVRNKKLLTNNIIREIQECLEQNKAGFRSTPGTTLKSQQTGDIVYTPPQDRQEIENYMKNLEEFINDDSIIDVDSLIKLAIIHHQFESIHPFYDGNGRTGRIINILYLVIKDLLDLPILYLSRYIISNKSEYYKLLQEVRDQDAWEPWILFILKGIEITAQETIGLVQKIGYLMQTYKVGIKKKLPNIYRHELLNNLFSHPYTKIEFVQQELNVNRQTASKYLQKLAEKDFIQSVKIGRNKYYLNFPLIKLFIDAGKQIGLSQDSIESVNQ